MKAFLFSRWNSFLHELNLYSCAQYIEINGEDYIEIEADEPLSKGDRILIQDGNGDWFEYVFNEGEQVHKGNQTYKMTCDNSLMWDLSLKHISYAGWDSANARYALTEILKLHPAWSVGTVLSTSSKKLVYERESAYQALLETCGTFNCEIKKEITVDKNGVVRRTVSLLSQIGEKKNIRFDYGDGIFGVTKTINAEPVLTACYGYGSGIDEEELKVYVTNDNNLKEWGLSDGHGAIIHAEGEFTDNDIEDADTLRAATTDYLNAHAAPSITYEMDEPYLALQGARLGDTVQSVDADFNPPVRLDTRIGSMERDLVTNIVTKAVFGNVISYLPDALARSFDQEKVIIRQTAVIGELRSDLKSTQSELSSTQSALGQTQSALSQTQTTLSQTQSSLSQAQRDLSQAQTDLIIAQNNAAAAQRNADAANKTANDLAVTVTNQGKTIDSQEKTIASQSSAIEQLQSDVADLSDNLRRYRMSYANGYNAVQDICNTYLACCINGTPMTATVRNRMDGQYSTYNTAVNDYGILHNYGAEWMYQQLMALPVSDEGGEEPSIGDEPGEGPQIMEPDTSSDTDSDTDTTETPTEEA